MTAALIEESIDIDATPEQVWSVISDLKRMGEWSPQCKKMIIRGGTVGLGTKTININRRGPLVWPTTSKVVRFTPNQELGFRVAENHTIWSYTITPKDAGVTVTERREVNGSTTKVSSASTERSPSANFRSITSGSTSGSAAAMPWPSPSISAMPKR